MLSALIVQWENFRGEDRSKNYPKQLTLSTNLIIFIKKVRTILLFFSIDGIFLQARYLPTPLNEIHELFPLITAYDCFTLLSNIWNYLKQNQQLLTNRSQQQSIARDSLFYDPIRYVIQKNIADLGHIAKHFLHFQLQTTLSIT